MKCLTFSRTSRTIDGRRVRTAAFEDRSAFPVAAACLVANGIRESLARLFASDTLLSLCEPVIPAPNAWSAIARDALCFRARGTAADAALVLAPIDAVTLATAAFGEPDGAPRALSSIERTVLERAFRALAPALSPACGQIQGLDFLSELAGYSTYFELLVRRPAAFRIGVALSHEPAPATGATLRPHDLLDIDLDLTASVTAAPMPAFRVATLQLGEIVPMTQEKGLAGTLALAGTVLARGECGVRSGRYALAVNESI